MRRNQRGVVFLPVLIILILIGAVGYFAYQNYQLKNTPPAITNNSPRSTSSDNETVPTDGPISPAPALDLTSDWNTYTNKEHGFSFKYPQGLKPLEKSNGEVSFFSPDSHDACVAAQDSDDDFARDACFAYKFSFGSFETNPVESYEEYTTEWSGDASLIGTLTDNSGREWKTVMIWGQTYMFDAFTHLNSVPTRVSFYYGFDFPPIETVQSFFNQILSTFQFTE